jgi:surface antigen
MCASNQPPQRTKESHRVFIVAMQSIVADMAVTYGLVKGDKWNLETGSSMAVAVVTEARSTTLVRLYQVQLEVIH